MMALIKKNKVLLLYLCFFILFNSVLYLFIQNFNQIIKFNRFNYQYSAHHYFQDERISGGSFNFLRALGQYDAQWYLKIASVGYPKNPQTREIRDKGAIDGLTYAFFPLYPLTLFLFNMLFGNIELTAFVVANLLLVLNFFGLYYVIGKLFSKDLALKSIFLIFAFPFAIFLEVILRKGYNCFC